jgi:hypothetical protein
MIDGRSLDLARSRRRGEQEQGKAVRPPRYGNAKARAGLGKRVQRTPESLDQLGRRLKRTAGGIGGFGHWSVLLDRFGDRQSFLP